MDPAEVASDYEELDRQEAISLALKTSHSPVATGKCLWCGEDIHPEATNKRFCDAEHRDEYDNWMKRHPEILRGARAT